MLDGLGHRTPWVGGGAADGHRRRSPRRTAITGGPASCTWPRAEIYARIPDVTDRMLALAAGRRGARRAGDRGGGRARRWPRCATFALRNEAPGLLALARRPVPTPGRAVAC